MTEPVGTAGRSSGAVAAEGHYDDLVSAISSSRSRLASALSTRSTFRREPSGNRTHAIHRPAVAFHRTVGSRAIYDHFDVASEPKAAFMWLRAQGASLVEPVGARSDPERYPVETMGLEPTTSCLQSRISRIQELGTSRETQGHDHNPVTSVIVHADRRIADPG